MAGALFLAVGLHGGLHPHVPEPPVSAAAGGPAAVAMVTDAVSAAADACVAGAGRLVHAYQTSLREHYDTTTAVQAFVLVAMGDLIAQGIEASTAAGGAQAEAAVLAEAEERGEALVGQALPADGQHGRLDLVRTLRMGSLGLLIGGIGTSHWLQFLESKLPGHASPTIVLEKATLDACLWAPVANGAYLMLTPILEGDDAATVKRKVEGEFMDVMKTELLTFFPYNLVSFSVVPPLLRPFTTGFVSMCFGVYISWVTHKVTREAPAAPLPAAAGAHAAASSYEHMFGACLDGEADACDLVCLESPELDECRALHYDSEGDMGRDRAAQEKGERSVQAL